jgi:transposase-like protein
MPPLSSRYTRHRFPGEIISHTVWRYFRVVLSSREVEDLLAECGIAVRYETIRRWSRDPERRSLTGSNGAVPTQATSGTLMKSS